MKSDTSIPSLSLLVPKGKTRGEEKGTFLRLESGGVLFFPSAPSFGEGALGNGAEVIRSPSSPARLLVWKHPSREAQACKNLNFLSCTIIWQLFETQLLCIVEKLKLAGFLGSRTSDLFPCGSEKKGLRGTDGEVKRKSCRFFSSFSFYRVLHFSSLLLPLFRPFSGRILLLFLPPPSAVLPQPSSPSPLVN